MKTLIKTLLFGRRPRVRSVWFGNARGLRLMIDPTCKSQRIVGLDEYEIAKPFRLFAEQAQSFVDIGASDGYYLLMARHINKKIKCVGCEPQQDLMEKGIAMLRDNFGHLDFFEHVDSLVGTQAACRSLDEITRDLPKPLFIKVDVDGAEIDVLESGRNCLTDRQTTLIVETHSKELERSAIAFLESCGKSVKIIPNGRLRRFVPEHRPIPHNRWLTAT